MLNLLPKNIYFSGQEQCEFIVKLFSVKLPIFVLFACVLNFTGCAVTSSGNMVGAQSAFNVSELKALPKVGIVYSYSNIEADMVEPMLKNGYKGIVHAGVGNGNIHRNVFPVLEEARKQGILVVRSSRVPTGPSTLDNEVDDARYEFVASQQLNPQKARILLMLALTQTDDWKKIQEFFNEY